MAATKCPKCGLWNFVVSKGPQVCLACHSGLTKHDAEHPACSVRPFLCLVDQELTRARGMHAPMHSVHEGFAVLLEEVDELKAEVWKKASLRQPLMMLSELIQIAAMAVRMAEDCGLTDGVIALRTGAENG